MTVMPGLSVNRLISVTVTMAPLQAQARSFDSMLILGSSDVISAAERIREYGSLGEVAADFGTSAKEYLAAELFFAQNPQPLTVLIGRWAQVPTHGQNIGGLLPASEQVISAWTGIHNGSFGISVDGVAQTLTGLDFSAQTNLNGVAAVINASLLSSGTCVWNGKQFIIKSGSTGGGAKATGTITFNTNPSPGVRAHGTISFTGVPAVNDVVDVNGINITFVSGVPSGNQVQIGVDATNSAQNLLVFLQASADPALSVATYSRSTTTVTVTYRTVGVAGNAFTLSETSTAINVSGATLTLGAAADTIVVNGTTLTFVDLPPAVNQIQVGASNIETAANMLGVLNASTDPNITKATYARSLGPPAVTNVVYKTVGLAGNSFTLSFTSSHISTSGTTLTGGVTGSSVGYATPGGVGTTDLSAQLHLTQTTGADLVSGYASETPVACVAIMDNMFGSQWYGAMFASTDLTNTQHLAVSDYIEAAGFSHLYGITTTDLEVADPLSTQDIAYLTNAGGYKRTIVQYSQNPYAIASLFGRAFTVNFMGNSTTIDLMYKQEPTVVAENLSTQEVDALEDKHCNIFVQYNNNTAIIERGTMAGDAYFDEMHGTDWLAGYVQNNLYNLLYTSPTKIPQTDAGVHMLVNNCSASLDQGLNNGLIAPGQWNSTGFGTLKTGDVLSNGYYVYVPPIATQNPSDRAARKAPPIQIAVKLAGSIQTVDVAIMVNR